MVCLGFSLASSGLEGIIHHSFNKYLLSPLNDVEDEIWRRVNLFPPLCFQAVLVLSCGTCRLEGPTVPKASPNSTILNETLPCKTSGAIFDSYLLVCGWYISHGELLWKCSEFVKFKIGQRIPLNFVKKYTYLWHSHWSRGEEIPQIF